MSDRLTPQQRHDCMSHIRSNNTKLEVRLRKELFRFGYMYRLNVKNLPGKPDIVLAKYRSCKYLTDVINRVAAMGPKATADTCRDLLPDKWEMKQ